MAASALIGAVPVARDGYLRIAAVLRQNLSDDQLKKLAGQARSEALYWYGYMQGLERTRGYQ